MNVLNKTERKKTESAWHDEWVSGKSKEVVFYDTPFLQDLLKDLESYAMLKLGNINAKKVLYYGCGTNIRPAMQFVEKGATVYMIDISPKSIEFLSAKISELGIEKHVFPMVMNCENLSFLNNEFDAIYGRAILHHLDLAQAIKEMYRVLKPNGRLIFIEPLGVNPLINLYRTLTPHRRTPDERPLDDNDIRLFANAGFSHFSHREFTLLSIIGIFLNSVLKIPDKLVIGYNKLRNIDDLILMLFPHLRKYCWNTVLIAVK